MVAELGVSDLGAGLLLLFAAAASAAVRFARHGRVPPGDYRPAIAWSRALTYVVACWGVSVITGTFSRLVAEAPVTSQQVSDPRWWAGLLICVATIVIGYGVIWGRWTLHFDRPRRPAPQIAFGLLWGSGTGQLLLSTWVVWDSFSLPGWVAWLGAYVTIAAWQGTFQNMYWDVYVTPEHETPWSLTRKVLCTHIPNITVTLTFLAVYGNELIFVGLQTPIGPSATATTDVDESLPLDGTAHARELGPGDGRAGDQLIERRPQIRTVERLAVGRRRRIQATAIRQEPGAVVHEEVRSADRAVRRGGGLGLVVQVRERVADLLRPTRHLLGPVSRVRRNVVRGDGDEGDPLRLVVLRNGDDLWVHVDHVRAVVADEHDHGGGRGADRLQGHEPTVDCVGQLEVGGWAAQRGHRRGCGHDVWSLSVGCRVSDAARAQVVTTSFPVARPDSM